MISSYFINIRFKTNSNKASNLANFDIKKVFDNYKMLSLFKTKEGYRVSKKTYSSLKPYLKKTENGSLILYASQVKRYIKKVDDNEIIDKAILQAFL